MAYIENPEEWTLRTRYRLAMVAENQVNGSFSLGLDLESEQGYGSLYCKSNTFDSIEEGIKFTRDNREWHYREFVLLPVYDWVKF